MVGAGLAGLAAAAAIGRAGRRVLVLEAADGVGGRVRTDEVEGHLLDRGFQVLLTAYPELDRLDVDALELRRFEPGAVVWRGSVPSTVGDPFRRPRTLGTTVLAPVGSPVDKLRLLRLRRRLLRSDPRVLLGGDDTSTLRALTDEGFSERMIERFFRPLLGGIQLDPSLSASRRIFDVIFRTLAAGDAAVPANGMRAIPEQMAAALPEGTIALDSPVTSVGPRVVHVGEATVEAAAVVVATAGPAAAHLLGLPAVASRSAGCVYFAAETAPSSSRHVQLGADAAGPVNVAVMSNVAPAYAPEGSHLVAVAFPGIDTAEVERAVVDRARAVARTWWGARVDQWRPLRTYLIEHGQPDQRPPFSPQRPVALGDGMFVCGDHRDTGSIQGAMFSGRRCGDAVAAYLGGTTPT